MYVLHSSRYALVGVEVSVARWRLCEIYPSSLPGYLLVWKFQTFILFYDSQRDNMFEFCAFFAAFQLQFGSYTFNVYYSHQYLYCLTVICL